MTNIELNTLKAMSTQLCDSLDALTDALREALDKLRDIQDACEPSRSGREYVLVPPPQEPLPGPSL
jgi:hypothetical protein